MYSLVRNRVLLIALRRSLRRRAPSRMPYSSSNNYYVPQLFRSDDSREILVDSIRGQNVSGRLWVGNEFSEPIVVPFVEINEWSLRVLRFYGYQQHQYESVWLFWRHELTLTAQISWFRERLVQFSFNANLRFRKDRMSVLKRLIDLHFEYAAKGNGLLDDPNPQMITKMIADFFGKRVYSHPKFNEIAAHFRLITRSLKESGELVEDQNGGFALSPKALNTVSAFELEERRHKDNVRHNWLIFVLTLVIAISTALGVARSWMPSQAESCISGSLGERSLSVCQSKHGRF